MFLRNYTPIRYTLLKMYIYKKNQSNVLKIFKLTFFTQTREIFIQHILYH